MKMQSVLFTYLYYLYDVVVLVVVLLIVVIIVIIYVILRCSAVFVMHQHSMAMQNAITA